MVDIREARHTLIEQLAELGVNAEVDIGIRMEGEEYRAVLDIRVFTNSDVSKLPEEYEGFDTRVECIKVKA